MRPSCWSGGHSTWQAMEDALSATTEKRFEYLSSMHGYLCTMEFRKRGTPVAPATPKFACSRMCARLQKSLRWQCIVELPPPLPEKKENTNRQRSLSSRLRPRAHTRGHPCREYWRSRHDKAAGPTRFWSMPSTRGFPARAHPRATPQTGRSGLQAASRDDALPLTRSKLACTCLLFLPDHVSLSRKHDCGRDPVTMLF